MKRLELDVLVYPYRRPPKKPVVRLEDVVGHHVYVSVPMPGRSRDYKGWANFSLQRHDAERLRDWLSTFLEAEVR